MDELVFPAHAGVILMEQYMAGSKWGLSRTCGGDPYHLIL